MALVDTHAHLCYPAFAPDRKEVLDRAEEAGVGAVLAVGETAADARRNLELAAADRRIRPAAGLFPKIMDRGEAAAVEEIVRRERDRLVAVGEVGLDYWKVKDEEERTLQRELFARFVDLAVELDLPLNVHSRSTGRQAIELLLERGARKVQLHAFDGRAATARPAVEAGYLLLIPPSVVHSPQKRKLVRQLPLDCLLVETDSPVLGPDPKARNEPANAILSVREIAAIKGLSETEVEEAVTANTRRHLRRSGIDGRSRADPVRRVRRQHHLRADPVPRPGSGPPDPTPGAGLVPRHGGRGIVVTRPGRGRSAPAASTWSPPISAG